MQHTIRYRTKLKNWLGTSRIPLLEDVCICTIDYECIDKCVAELRDENLAMILVFYISTILEMSSGLRASGLRAAVCGAGLHPVPLVGWRGWLKLRLAASRAVTFLVLGMRRAGRRSLGRKHCVFIGIAMYF